MNINQDTPNQGFTLIELLVVVAIIGITLAIAVPSFQTMIASNRLTTSTNNLVSALQLAKSEAIKSNRLVALSNNGTWDSGWVVFADIDKSGNQANDGSEPTIGSFDALNTGFTINTANNGTITYRPDGRVDANVPFDFCSPKQTADFRRVVIQPTGRIQVQTPAVAGVNYAAVC